MRGRNSIPYSSTGRTNTIVDVLSYCYWNTGIRMLLRVITIQVMANERQLQAKMLTCMMDMESQVQPLGRNVVLEPQIGVIGDADDGGDGLAHLRYPATASKS